MGAGVSVWLDSCESAVTSLSEKETWSLATDGSLVHAASKKCQLVQCWRRAEVGAADQNGVEQHVPSWRVKRVQFSGERRESLRALGMPCARAYTVCWVDVA